MSCAHLLLLLLCATIGAVNSQHDVEQISIQSDSRGATQISKHPHTHVHLKMSASSNDSGGHDNGSESCSGCDCDHGEASAHSAGVTIASWNYCEVRQPLMLSAFMLALIILLLCWHYINFLREHIPESCALIFLGCGIGGLIRLTLSTNASLFLKYDRDTFILYILPPSTLEAAYSLKDRTFNESIGTILLYAVVGTLLNATLIALPLYWITKGSVDVELVHIFVFASLIAAVDPIAVLDIFEELGVTKMLYFLVFGESLLNDAVVLCMYKVTVELAEFTAAEITTVHILLAIAKFLVISLGAIIIGTVSGFISAFITKHTERLRVVEPMILFLTAYLSYLLAELFELSGIVAIICCGIIQSQYAFENISAKSYVSTRYTTKVAAHMVESLIFVILGVMIVNPTVDASGTHSFWQSWNTPFAFAALGLVFVVRFVVCFGITFFVNRHTDGIRRITYQEQFIMSYGGLRGAIAFSLVFGLTAEQIPSRDMLLCTTYFIIILSLFVQGISLKPLVHLLNVRSLNHHEGDPYKLFIEFNYGTINNMMTGAEEIIGYKGTTHWLAFMKNISHSYLRPFFQRHKTKTFRHRALIAAHEEIQLKETGNVTQRSHGAKSTPRTEALMDQHLETMEKSNVSRDAYLADENDGHEHDKKKSKPIEPKTMTPATTEAILNMSNSADLLKVMKLVKNRPQDKLHYKSHHSITDAKFNVDLGQNDLQLSEALKHRSKVKTAVDAMRKKIATNGSRRKVTMETGHPTISGSQVTTTNAAPFEMLRGVIPSTIVAAPTTTNEASALEVEPPPGRYSPLTKPEVPFVSRIELGSEDELSSTDPTFQKALKL